MNLKVKSVYLFDGSVLILKLKLQWEQEIIFTQLKFEIK